MCSIGTFLWISYKYAAALLPDYLVNCDTSYLVYYRDVFHLFSQSALSFIEVIALTSVVDRLLRPERPHAVNALLSARRTAADTG